MSAEEKVQTGKIPSLHNNQWLIDEGRYNQATEHVLIKIGEVLDIYTDFH